MQHHSQKESLNIAYRGLIILAVITITEVIISLFGKGYLGWKEAYYLTWVHYVAGSIIIIFSLYKAYYIVYNFMHLGLENKSLIRTVLVPLLLLLFAIFAFLWEGNHWHINRSYIVQQNELPSDRVVPDIPPTLEAEHIKNIH